jgi:hypothetical protein
MGRHSRTVEGSPVQLGPWNLGCTVVKQFGSVRDFVRHLATLAPRVEVAISHGIREGGRMIQEEAQRAIGDYQPSVGPFPAWAPLADATLNGAKDLHGHYHPGKVELGFSPPDNPLLRTGELHDHIELSIAHHRAVVGVPDETVGDGTRENPVRNIGDVAVWLEFGDRYMPARSFLGRAGYVRGKHAAHAIGHAVFLALAGKVHVEVSPHSSAGDDIPF